MPYNSEVNWATLVQTLERHGRNMTTAVREANEAYAEWLNFRAGRTNLQIATALGRTEAEVADMDAAYSAFSQTIGFLSGLNVALLVDHLAALRKFT